MDPQQTAAYFSSDKIFDSLFPYYIRDLSEVHWTPLAVAFEAARFLAPDENARIIDIGAGVGKFCMACSFTTAGQFTGIEQRKNFVKLGNKNIKKLGLTNASILHGNFTDLDLTKYSGIYFFNSFHENLVESDALDKNIERSPEIYTQYTIHFLQALNTMPAGTRLATYYLTNTEVPLSYRLVETHFNDLLKLWIKSTPGESIQEGMDD